MDNNLNVNDLLNQLKEEQKSKQAQYEKVCWFCKSNQPAEKNRWAKQQLTKPAPSKSYKVESTYELQTTIPRCNRCFTIHLIKKIFNWVFALMFLLPMVFLSLPYQLMYIGSYGLVIGFIVYRLAIIKFTKPEGYKLKYSPILEMKNQGYKRWWVTMFARGFQQK